MQATEARIRDMSPAQLVKGSNPCAVTPQALHAALRKYAQTNGGSEMISLGVVAQCDASSVSLSLPIAERVNFERLQQVSPDIANLWDLASQVTQAAFGSDEVFHQQSESDDLIIQRAGEKLVSELISGRYDPGLAAASKGNVGTWHNPSFRSLLSSYQGPVSLTESSPSKIQLRNAQTYQFSRFVVPTYAPLALQASIQGKVELQLAVEPATGEVRSVTAISGHPILKPLALEAAKQWRFAPNSIQTAMVNITLDFAIRCQ